MVSGKNKLIFEKIKYSLRKSSETIAFSESCFLDNLTAVFITVSYFTGSQYIYFLDHTYPHAGSW